MFAAERPRAAFCVDSSGTGRCMPAVRAFVCAFVVLTAAASSPFSHAETRVSGVAGAVQLETNDATIGEALAALGTAMGLRYRTSAALDRRITGTYAGPLERVVSRLLQ